MARKKSALVQHGCNYLFPNFFDPPLLNLGMWNLWLSRADCMLLSKTYSFIQNRAYRYVQESFEDMRERACEIIESLITNSELSSKLS
jgi:hypothetical protein